MVTFLRFGFLLILLTLFAEAKEPNADLFFMPKEASKALKTLTRDLKNAEQSIQIALYSFTHPKIAKALRKAAKRGVHITAVFDHKNNLKKPHSKAGEIAVLKNVDVYHLKGLPKKNYFGKLHHKFAIIDNKILYFGSANWSRSAFSVNYEMLYRTWDKALIKKSSRAFETLKERATPLY